MLKGDDWQYSGFLCDKEDTAAQGTSLITTMNKQSKLKMSDADRKVHLYICGFTRGTAWMRDKVLHILRSSELSIEEMRSILEKSIPPKQ